MNSASMTKSHPDFNKVAEKYYKLVLGWLQRKEFSRDACEDLAQETFLQAQKGFQQFRGKTDPEVRKFLLTTARNVLNNSIREGKTLKRSATVVPLEDATLLSAARDQVDSHSGPLRRLLVDERRSELRRVIDQLPKKMRLIVLFRCQEPPVKYKEIASLVGVDINTVKSALHKAREKLAGQLKNYSGIDDL